MAWRTRAGKPLQRAAPAQHKFKVQLYDFCCENLQCQDEKCEAFLKLHFDDCKAWKTEHEAHNLNPEFGFRAAFQYSLTYLEQLCKRQLKVQCLNKHTGQVIGSTSIDLQTVACGPIHYQLTLLGGDGNTAKGTVKFACVMKMLSTNLTVICQDLTLTMLGCYASASLQINSTLEEKDHKAKVVHAPHSQQGIWPGPFSFVFETTLKDLLKAESLRFVVIDEMGVRQGEAHLEYRKAFSIKAETIIDFKVPVTFTCTVEGEDAPSSMGAVGELEGIVLYQNLPVYAQMVNGVYIDDHVEGGHMFIEGLPYPQCMAEPPPVWQDPGDRTGFDNFLAEQYQEESGPLNFEDLDDKLLSEALAQIELPPPWEKRRERDGGHMYFLDPRSRRMTWKDPRFLSENWDQRIDQQTGKVYFQYHKTRETSQLDPRGCPTGWEMRLSKNGDVFFAHLPSKTSTFTDPRGLPENIEAALDDQGRMYFKCHESKTTTWEDPRNNQQEVVLAHWRHQQLMAWTREQILKEIEQRADEQRADLDRDNDEESDVGAQGQSA